VVLSGDGKAFCAGLDTSLFAAMAERDPTHGGPGTTGAAGTTGAIRVEAVQAVRVWVDMAAPVIAAVHGVAVGGGFQLALGADLRVVAPDAQLGVFEIKWGIVPDMCGTQLLPRLVGPDVAKDLMFTGRVISGVEAQALGLVTRLSDDPRSDALDLAREIVSRNPDAIKVMKRLVDAAWTLPFDDGVREERDRTEGMIGSKNQLEAVVANLEGRPGRFED
jgi:enoyl-CoA hydratase/carnithine racemase